MNELFSPKTKNGYALDEVASAIQKSIRRGDEETALFFALELFPYYAKYLWKRIGVVCVEDIESPEAITNVNAMRDAFFFNNQDNKKSEDYVNRIFITKAITYLCREVKSREADHAQHYIDSLHKKGKMIAIPEYAFDVHTAKGRTMGKTKNGFFKDEQEGLSEKGRDDYYEKIKKND